MEETATEYLLPLAQTSTETGKAGGTSFVKKSKRLKLQVVTSLWREWSWSSQALEEAFLSK
jgi:hypothetical protein